MNIEQFMLLCRQFVYLIFILSQIYTEISKTETYNVRGIENIFIFFSEIGHLFLYVHVVGNHRFNLLYP